MCHSTGHWIVCVTERLWIRLPRRPCVIIYYSTEVEQSRVFVSYRPSMYYNCVNLLRYGMSVCDGIKRIYFFSYVIVCIPVLGSNTFVCIIIAKLSLRIIYFALTIVTNNKGTVDTLIVDWKL